ncbi:MAG: S8 family serine peptidase [Anaerolineales bacterium]|nr:S8 family serine peptidase [Anaerolineales bacterium]
MIKKISLAVLSFVLFLSLGAVQPVQAQAPLPDIDRDAIFVPGEVVVSFDDGLQAKQYMALAQALAGTVGAQVVDQYEAMALLSFDESSDVPALAAQIGGQSGVRYAEPNYIMWIPEIDLTSQPHTRDTIRISYASEDGTIQQEIPVEQLRSMRSTGPKISSYPNDGFESWGWFETGAWKIWIDKVMAPGVCVLDTGVDANHPDLKGRVVNGYDFVNDDKVPNDDNVHGTHVAGTIAAIANNNRGLSGVSNGKVVAVKVLSAQGWGTIFDIAAGIRFCADHKDVKVLNMSLGGGNPSTTYWYALDYAINAKGKLVVAAAGNSSLNTDAYPMFPAAWADPNLYPNGTGLGGSYGTNIAHGILSVGAQASYSKWIDMDNDGVGWDPDDEDYWDERFWECAASFSNYGTYVEIVAPGESIYSTTPVSYPFHSGYFEGIASGYDWLSGTSMATPHVAGGAARVWGLFKNESNAQIKARLLAYGDPVFVTEDPLWDDHDEGYWDDGYTGDAPYCWPASMSNSVHLDISGAMERSVASGAAVDAQTGLPLVGAKVNIRDWYTKKAVSGSGVATVTGSSRWFDVLNLPTETWYGVLVNAKGYTAGAQEVGYVYAFDCGRMCVSVNSSIRNVSVPPNIKNTMFVTLDWDGFDGDLDLNLFLPSGSPGMQIPYHTVGTLRDFPYARWYRDGGVGSASDWYVGSETVAIAKKGKTLHYGNLGAYNVFVVDWDSVFTSGFSTPYIRLWDAGKVIDMVFEDCDPGDAYWYVYDLGGSPNLSRNFVDICSVDNSWFPYAVKEELQGIPEMKWQDKGN